MRFLDTSGLLCLFDESDARHARAKLFLAPTQRHVTHNLVLAEFIPLWRKRRTRHFSIGRAVDFLHDILCAPHISVFWHDQRLFRSALSLLARRADKSYSLCDAMSFLVMRQVGILEALTTDHHFEQEGFVRLLDG